MAARRSPQAGRSADPPHPAATPPATPGMVVARERLHALLDARLPGAVWLHGPTGAGKTVLLRAQLGRDRRPAIWITADERHRDPAALFAAIGGGAASLAGAPLPAASLPVFSPEHRDAPAAFADDYFARLDQALPPDAAVVVDDVHHLVGFTAPLLAKAIDAFGGRRTLCFASQLMPDAAFAPQVAGSRLWIVGHRALAFDDDEARGLASRIGAPCPDVEALVGATDGWAAGLMLAMQFSAGTGAGSGSDDPLGDARTPLALLIAGQVLGGVGADELVRLRLFAELPQVPMELADVAPAWAAACARLQSLSERGLFVERLSPSHRPTTASSQTPSNVKRLVGGCWRLHDLFRNALRAPDAIPARDVEAGQDLTQRLLAVNRLDLAWQLAARLGGNTLAAAVATDGAAALRSAHLPVLLQTAQPHATRDFPTVAVWQARGCIGSDPAGALALCDAAYEGFRSRGDAEEAALAAALALFVVFAEIENVGDVAAWATRLAEVTRESFDAATDSETRALRIAGEVVHDLLIGGRAADPTAQVALQDRLMAIVTDEVLPADETVIAGSLLVAAMRRATRAADVELAIVRVESVRSFAMARPHIRANWQIENGYHFTRLGLYDEARRRFDAALDVADANALLQPRIAALIGYTRLELGLADIRQATASLSKLEDIGQARLGRQRGWVQHLKARVETLAGQPSEGLKRIEVAEALISSAGFPPSTKVILEQDRIQMLYAAGAFDESFAVATKALEAVGVGGDGRRLEIVRGLLQAHVLRNIDPARTEALLRRHLSQAGDLKVLSFASLLPKVAAQVFADGLRHGIEVGFVTQAVHLRRLPAPADAPPNWPWPVRVEVMKPFGLSISGQPVAFMGKTQQKPLELLKYLACDRHLLGDATTVAAALWPAAEDGAAKKSLEVTVSRLRKLLGDEGLVIVREGKVALDPARVSSDAREFLEAALEAESVAGGRSPDVQVAALTERLTGLFQGLPLEHEDSTAWREGVRERYRLAFVRAVRTLADHWQVAGHPSRALDLVEKAVTVEPLAESLYRFIMQAHLDTGHHAEAMRTYRQCRQMLSVLIGTKPSVETERLKDLIHLQ